MGFDEKVDVIDLIINVLRDHEKTLDDLIARLEEALTGGAPLPPAEGRAAARRPTVTAVLRRWSEFRERCAGASLVAFDVEERRFRVSAVKDGVLYSYQEEMPEMEIRFREKEERTVVEAIDLGGVEQVPAVLRGRLECGLEVSVKGVEFKLPDGGAVYKAIYDIDADKARSWLSDQLKIEKETILQGELQI